MSNTNKLRLCRGCGSDISSLEGDPERCPYCTTKIKIPTSKFYKSPDYLSRQRDILEEELKLRKLKPGDSKFDQEYAEIYNELTRWARRCPDADKIAAMLDAEIILRELIHSEAGGQTMAKVVYCAKKLASLADVIEKYFAQGGSPNDREIRPILPEFRDDGGGQAAASAGGSSRVGDP